MPPSKTGLNLQDHAYLEPVIIYNTQVLAGAHTTMARMGWHSVFLVGERERGKREISASSCDGLLYAKLKTFNMMIQAYLIFLLS